MTNYHTKRLLPAVLACGALTGCALFSKNEPLMPRYYTPEYAVERPSSTSLVSARSEPKLSLRLGRVSAAASLRERMAYRTSDNELAYRDDTRWTERPEAYLAQALSRALFEERGLTMVISGSAPTLEVSLTAFEEIVGKDHKVRAEAVVTLVDDTSARLHETVRIEQDVPAVADKKERAGAVVRALSEALRKLVTEVAEHSIVTLSAMASGADPQNPGAVQVAPISTVSVP